jgi:hypothetical protein
MEDIEEYEHEISNTQAFPPMPSNDEEEQDVPLTKTFVDTPKEGTNISPFTPKRISCKLPKVSGKITYRKQSLIRNDNYLAKAMNKFVEGSINAERHKLPRKE